LELELQTGHKYFCGLPQNAGQEQTQTGSWTGNKASLILNPFEATTIPKNSSHNNNNINRNNSNKCFAKKKVN